MRHRDVVVALSPGEEFEAVKKRLENIQPGEQVIYFRGYPGQSKQTDNARSLFAAARKLLEARRLTLAQRRVPELKSVFDYIAIGCSQHEEKPKARVTVVRGGPAPFDMPAVL